MLWAPPEAAPDEPEGPATRWRNPSHVGAGNGTMSTPAAVAAAAPAAARQTHPVSRIMHKLCPWQREATAHGVQQHN
eukprot:15456972-Alexandrium_andersonii.AAC.1